MAILTDSKYLARALNSFDGYLGAEMPSDPTNETEYLALKPTGGDTKVWSGTVPSWADVVAKQAALKKADEDKEATKISAYKKLGLTDAEIAAIG
mgnify:CR=1 FL=1|tara:strand:- start:114 stop:398 length:285 start_codon:yes stop_codon:yes gene_type:complete